MTLIEILVNTTPEVDILGVFSQAETLSIKFLFFYLPILVCALASIKGLQFIYRGLRLLHMTRNGKYFRGRVVGKYRETEDFFETGRLFLFTYPVVQYKYNGELCTCISNKPQKKKIGKILSVYVCSDGDEHLMSPGIFTIIYGVALVLLGGIGATFMYNTFNIFA